MDFTLSNARQFYLPMGDPLGEKALRCLLVACKLIYSFVYLVINCKVTVCLKA